MSAQPHTLFCPQCSSELTADHYCPTCEGYPVDGATIKSTSGSRPSPRLLDVLTDSVVSAIRAAKPSFTFGGLDPQSLGPGNYTAVLTIEDEWEQTELLENYIPQVTLLNAAQDPKTGFWKHDLRIEVEAETTLDLAGEVDYALRNLDVADLDTDGFPHTITQLRRVS